jgi:hypothetical protein
MRTSLNEIRDIEAYLSGASSPEYRLLFEARMLLQPELQQKTREQQHIYHLVKAYSRNQLKNELDKVHEHLLTSPEHSSFRQRILRLFTKS